MREIKFRAWYPLFKKMINVEDYPYEKWGWFFNDNSLKRMQFTGLKDKNGREIYEGDIVQTLFSKREGFVYECLYHEVSGSYLFDPFMLGDKEAPLLGIEEFAQSWDEVEICEIIGNIYDNPELLGDSK